MILVLTNADTEILGLRAVLEGLPAGFPPVRAANPAALEAPPDLEGVQMVLVRLLGGRRAWERPFDDLRRACIHGTIMASFNCQSFSTERLTALTQSDIDTRFEEFRGFTHFD